MLLGETQAFASPEEALVHYGKKGMRWGVRKEEDTVGRDAGGRVVAKSVVPLSEKKQARVDKFVKRSETMNTKISELKVKNESLEGTRNLAKLYERRLNKQTIADLDKAQQRAVRDSEAVQKGKLTSAQKKVVIGAVGATAVIGVAGFIAIKSDQSGAVNSAMLRGAAFVRGEKLPFKVNGELSRHMSANELLTNVARPVNPGYKSPGGKMNCRRSTFAYELRRRGFDVHATTSSVGWGQSESGVINAVTTEGKDFFSRTSMSETVVRTGRSSVASGDTRKNPLAKILLDDLTNKNIGVGNLNISSSKKVLEELGKQPNGARGEVLFKFPGFGHSMAYEVVDGVPHIFDSQKGTLYNSSKMVESKWDGFHGAEITRLDNVDLDLNFLTRWATNTGSPKASGSGLLEGARERVRERTHSDFDVAWT